MCTSCNGFKVLRLIKNDVSSLNKAFFGPVAIICSEKYILKTIYFVDTQKKK